MTPLFLDVSSMRHVLSAGDLFRDLEQEWATSQGTSGEPKGLWEELADIGEEFVEFLEKVSPNDPLLYCSTHFLRQDITHATHEYNAGYWNR